MPSHSSIANISPHRPMQVCTSSTQSSQPHLLQIAPSRSQNAWLGAWMPPSPSTGSIITPATWPGMHLLHEQVVLEVVEHHGVVERARVP